MLDFDENNGTKVTEIDPLLPKTSTVSTVNDPVVEFSSPMNSSISLDSVNSNDSQEIPALNKSITKAIQIERKRKQTIPSSPGAGKVGTFSFVLFVY
jgi:hypothetical protein